MGLAAFFGEANLFLSFAESRHLRVRERTKAARARDAFFEMRMLAIFGADRVAAGMAELIRANFEPVADADAVIKNETFAFPKAVFARHGFEVF